MKCANHLKQIGLAFHSHHDTLNLFPDGGEGYYSSRTMSGGTPATAPDQHWGWMYQILPYIEQDNLYKHPDQNYIRRTPLPIYFCPSRRQPMVLGGSRAMNDYAGNGGIYTSWGWAWGEGVSGVVVRRNRYAPVTLQSLTNSDGTANTIVAGEKRLDLLSMGSFQCDDNEGWTSGWDWDIIRWGNNPPQPDRNATDQCEVLFGSSHAGGVNFVYADGSVHFLAFSISQPAFYSLCHIRDGQ
ncbi:MAG: prepilin-type N-terminal cleavage/methylation domain-containing protein [Gemmatales bacterium]|nr:MAG: prepilin-type N-terminal cleavage/methylation domain-containing protein [Gemmatales bacterium]